MTAYTLLAELDVKKRRSPAFIDIPRHARNALAMCIEVQTFNSVQIQRAVRLFSFNCYMYSQVPVVLRVAGIVLRNMPDRIRVQVMELFVQLSG